MAPELSTSETNHAHALRYLNRRAEASALYLSHAKDKIADMNKSWRQTILDDFVELRKAGLTHPLMAEIEAAFANK